MKQNKERQILKIPAKEKKGVDLWEEENHQLRVAAYCRVSTELESQAGSYERQKFHYKEKIKKQEGWILAGIYADEGSSGTVKKKREGFLKLLQDCEGGKIDLILTKSISRFARNTVDLLTTIRSLKSKNIGVYFEKENIHTLDSTGEILITILSSLAQEESRNISENIRWSLRRKYEKGEPTINHNHFMGYTKDGSGNLVVAPKEAEIVRRIFHLYVLGYSSRYIAKDLEQNGMKTVMGKEKWLTSTIDRMLSNEKYIGDALLQKTHTIDFLTKERVKNLGALPKYYVKGNHEPIISEELFYAVQEEKLHRAYLARHEGTQPSPYALTGKVVCSVCGSYYYRIARRRGEHTTYLWRCPSRPAEVKKTHIKKERELHRILKEAFEMVRNAEVSPEDGKTKALWKLFWKMQELKEKQMQIIQENIRGFWELNKYRQQSFVDLELYYDLAEQMFARIVKSQKNIFVPQPWCPMEYNYFGNDVSLNEWINLYITRVWMGATNEIVVLFKNGSLVRKEWYY